MRGSVPGRRSWLVLAAAALASAVAAVTALALPGATPPQACRSTLIPAYVTPEELAGRFGDPEADGTRRLIVVNPDNGPGARQDDRYRAAIDAVRATGARVLGYVHTQYGRRDPAAVAADLKRYRSWYGVDGVFLDETSSAEHDLPYYRSVSRDARAVIGNGPIVVNPGNPPARGYFDVADIVVTFEGPAARHGVAVAAMPAWLRRLAPERTGHLLYGARRDDALAAAEAAPGAGSFYATDGALPNPWGVIPTWLAAVEDALDTCTRT